MIPCQARLQPCRDDPTGKNSQKPPIESQLRVERSHARQRDIVPWHQHLFESVPRLELGEGAIALVAVIELAVDEMRDPSGCAELHRLGEQGVCGPLVVVTHLGIQLQDGGDLSPIHELQKSNEFIAPVGSNKIAAINKLAVISFDLVDTLSVVRIAPALAHRRLILHLCNAADEFVTKPRNPDDNPALLRPPHVLASFLRQAFPPFLKAPDVNGSDALRIYWVAVSARRVG